MRKISRANGRGSYSVSSTYTLQTDRLVIHATISLDFVLLSRRRANWVKPAYVYSDVAAAVEAKAGEDHDDQGCAIRSFHVSPKLAVHVCNFGCRCRPTKLVSGTRMDFFFTRSCLLLSFSV